MINNDELYKPSIQEDFEITKTFNISRFYLISFFLGVTCMMLTGTLNAKWLKMKPSVIYGMIAVCILVFISKYGLIFIAQHGFFGLNLLEDRHIIKNIGRVLYLAVGFLYAFVLRNAYKKHMHVASTTEKWSPYLFRYGACSIAIEVVMAILLAATRMS